MTPPSDLSDNEFIATYIRSMGKLQRRHPECSRSKLVWALRHAKALMEHSGKDKVIAAASMLLDKGHPPAGGPSEELRRPPASQFETTINR